MKYNHEKVQASWLLAPQQRKPSLEQKKRHPSGGTTAHRSD
jgi:hypothetical protein